MSLLQRLEDWKRERRIRSAARQSIQHRGTPLARTFHNLMLAEIAARSPSYVARMTAALHKRLGITE